MFPNLSTVIRFSLKKNYIQLVFYSSQMEYACEKKIGKIVNVAVIGTPNSGKSTLINKITERKICAASNKVHTTTKLIRAMCYHNETQIIFLDTPGIVTDKEKKKYNLPESMIGACHKSLRCADVVGVVHDISNRYTKEYIHPDVISMLNSVEDIPSFLIINKVDQLKSKTQLLAVIRSLTNGYIAGKQMPDSKKDKKKLDKGYSKFSDVFMVSALNGDGVSDIKDYLTCNAKKARYHYSLDEWTDQTTESIIEEAVRAKFLDFLQQEIPYNLQIKLEYYDDLKEQDKIVCSLSVECPSERIMRLIGGAGGGRLNQIKSSVRNDLVELFKKIVVLDIRLTVKSKPLIN